MFHREIQLFPQVFFQRAEGVSPGEAAGHPTGGDYVKPLLALADDKGSPLFPAKVHQGLIQEHPFHTAGFRWGNQDEGG